MALLLSQSSKTLQESARQRNAGNLLDVWLGMGGGLWPQINFIPALKGIQIQITLIV